MASKDLQLLSNGVVVTSWDEPAIIADGAVAWQGDQIIGFGPARSLAAAYPDAHRIDAHGGLIVPGLINLHHHFYSALAKGLDPGRSMEDFAQILEGLWWRLDRALDMDTVRLSAQLTLADCIRWGCTTVFDHHASPSCLDGSLETIARTVEEAGLSAVLCYEVSDRNGHAEALAGLDENLSFAADHRHHPRIKGMIGLHASFTLDDATLAEAARRRPDDLGCHIHLAEDRLDISASRERYGADPITRLQRAGLLDRHSLLAHGVHLSKADLEAVAEAEATLIHNPQSNANNAVGRLDVPAATALGCMVGLGTDAMSSAMLRTLRSAFLAQRGGSGDPTTGFTALPQLLASNTRTARRFFDRKLLGELRAGAPADLAVIDYAPPTPLDEGNLFGHLIYGASEAGVRHTVAGGKVLLDDFRHTSIDVAALSRKARHAAPALWRRFERA